MFHSDALFFYAIFHERRDRKLDYVIKNNKNVYIRINDKGSPVTCSKNDRTLFEYSKAKNILNCLPKTMKKMRFVVEAVPEIQNQKERVKIDEIQSIKEKSDLVVLKKENYILSKNISRWIEKFGICDDILKEAKSRKEELHIALSNSDKELSNELHKIELENNKNACEGFYEYKKIKTILENRREIKDELLIIQNVIRMDFTSISSENVQKAVDGLAKRKFTLRLVEEEE